MRAFARILVSFICFALVLIGIMFMARSLSILAQPIIGQVGWYDYRLEFTEPFIFYAGCTMTAVGLTVLWAQLWSLRSHP